MRKLIARWVRRLVEWSEETFPCIPGRHSAAHWAGEPVLSLSPVTRKVPGKHSAAYRAASPIDAVAPASMIPVKREPEAYGRWWDAKIDGDAVPMVRPYVWHVQAKREAAEVAVHTDEAPDTILLRRIAARLAVYGQDYPEPLRGAPVPA